MVFSSDNLLVSALDEVSAWLNVEEYEYLFATPRYLSSKRQTERFILTFETSTSSVADKAINELGRRLCPFLLHYSDVKNGVIFSLVLLVYRLPRSHHCVFFNKVNSSYMRTATDIQIYEVMLSRYLSESADIRFFVMFQPSAIIQTKNKTSVHNLYDGLNSTDHVTYQMLFIITIGEKGQRKCYI